MRFVFVAVVAFVVACKTANPNVCCVTDAQCADLGVDEMRPCKAGQACAPDNTCVASECSDSSECTSPGAPVCVNNLCVASCSVDADCAGSPGGELCADDGVCVGCKSNADCDASAPFCDQEDRECRGCERDSECPGGVCLEADATCVSDAAVIFVAPDGQDIGDCSRSAPCDTIAYALTKFDRLTRAVVHIDGGNTFIGATISVGVSVYFDGTGTILGGDPSMKAFDIGSNTNVTFSGVVMAAGTGAAIVGNSSAKVRIHNSTLNRVVETTGGTLDISRSQFEGISDSFPGHVRCANGSLIVRDSHFRSAAVKSTNCALVFARNTIESASDNSLRASGGLLTIENNLIVHSVGLNDATSMTTAASGSTVRFNTFVNTTSTPSDGSAIFCDGTINATSNIFAYSSSSPTVGPGSTVCPTTYSLFDTVAVPAHSSGAGNKVSDATSFFADRSSKDFHLSTTSPAKAAAEPGLLIETDHDGNSRPQPQGEAADMGAFESP